jgi:nucleotide-binding universal stress UspA family protein
MTGMRVLLATDGSSCAAIAIDLVRNIPWPDGTVIHVVSAVEPQVAAYGPTVIGAAGDAADRQAPMISAVESDLKRIAMTLARPGREVEAHVLLGRPASAIVDSAQALGVDLIVVGSRGHGTIASMLLGSVSAEVADHARCPVLVARDSSWRRVTLATDGSDFARRAENLVARSPIFARTPVSVVSVADTDLAWPSALALSGFPGSYDYPAEEQARIAEHRSLADESSARLNSAGREASARWADGDPAAVLIKAARNDEMDVIVVGTHGLTGARRTLVGSVSRNVMLHAPCSVLVVREERAAS